MQVPVHFTNQEAAPGIKRGGALNIVYHTVEMWVPADNIPEAVIADLTGLDFNNSLHTRRFRCRRAASPRIPAEFHRREPNAAGGRRRRGGSTAAAAAPAAAPAKEEKKK